MVYFSESARDRARALQTTVVEALYVVAGLLLLVLATPFILLYVIFWVSFDAMYELQLWMSDLRRRQLFGDNSRNKAAQLPEEILHQIFQLLRTRAQFGFVPGLPIEYEYRYPSAYKHRALHDLASVRRVCRTWYPPGTVALYTDVAFASARDCVAFADTLVRHTRYARFVRGAKLPPEVANLPGLRPSEMRDRIPDNGNTRWLDLYAAENRILAQCVNLQRFSSWGRGISLEDVALIHRCPATLAHVTCCLVGCRTYSPNLDFDISHILGHFENLESLTLYQQSLKPPHAIYHLPALRTLRIHNCTIGPWYAAMLYHLPNLRAIDWRDNGSLVNGTVHTNLEGVVPYREKDIVSCTAFDCNRYHPTFRITLGDLRAFSSLRTLSITDRMLWTLTIPPHCLVELIITVAESRTNRFTELGTSRNTMFAIALYLKLHIPTWQLLYSPSLHSIQLWDAAVESPQLLYWGIVSLLLRQYLIAFGVGLAVNLILEKEMAERFESKFRRQKIVRHLLWRDVI